MKSFEEYNLRKIANKNMEFITPIKVREWIAKKVHAKFNTIKTVFDPAVGSGQLLQFVKAEKYIGCDINNKSIECFSKNFQQTESYNDNYFNLHITGYDIVVSNYPFSLNNKDLFIKAPAELDVFFKKTITGKADFSFIVRSFLNASKGGFYLCFPGIAYRGQEQKFRDFLINNNYVESFGILKNCKFDETKIDIFYLELIKNRDKDTIETFTIDFEDKEKDIIKIINVKDLYGCDWRSPELEKIKDEIDINEIEKRIEYLKNKRRKAEDDLDEFIKKTFKGE